jgi:hypothetical protein
MALSRAFGHDLAAGGRRRAPPGACLVRARTSLGPGAHLLEELVDRGDERPRIVAARLDKGPPEKVFGRRPDGRAGVDQRLPQLATEVGVALQARTPRSRSRRAPSWAAVRSRADRVFIRPTRPSNRPLLDECPMPRSVCKTDTPCIASRPRQVGHEGAMWSTCERTRSPK